jgi:V/A-type H+/Na+-transporting ATPase subunit C
MMNIACIQQHFAFAHGRIGVLQLLLLEQSDIDRLLGSKNLEDAQKMLMELKCTKLIDQSLHKSTEILNAMEEWIKKEILTIVPLSKRSTFGIIWLEEEFSKFSLFLKKLHGLSHDAFESFSPSNHFDAEFITMMKQQQNPTASSIDRDVSRFVSQSQIRLARASGSMAICNYVRHSIDLHNIRTALRTGDSMEHFLDGGTIPFHEFEGRDIKRIRFAIDKSPLAFSLTEEHLNFYEDPSSLERDLAKVTALDIAHLWNISIGIEPVFAFGAIAFSHIRLLRVLLMGKRNNLRPQEIKNLLPPFLPSTHYVVV